MPLKWSQIETWDSDQLHRYADVIGERQKTVEHQAKLIWVQFRNFYGSGKSADALREKMLIAHEELTVLADDLAEIWETIKLVAGDISQVQSAVQLARARAKSLNLEIAPDSTVNPGSSGVSINVYPSTDLQDVERLVARAIELAVGAGDAFHGAFTWAIERGGDADPERLIRFASSVAAVSVSSFGTRQWLASPALAELVRGW